MAKRQLMRLTRSIEQTKRLDECDTRSVSDGKRAQEIAVSIANEVPNKK
jgi:hypothetical protein